MWLACSYRSERPWCLLEKHQVAQPWFRRGFERSLPIGCPNIYRTPDSLFRPVVVVVSEGAHLGLELDSRDQLTVRDDQKVPFFLRTIPTWKFDVFLAIDMSFWKAALAQEVTHEIDEAIHLSSTSYCGACSSVFRPRGNSLFLGLSFSGVPEVLYSGPQPIIKCRT